jgi:hypothetical protein
MVTLTVMRTEFAKTLSKSNQTIARQVLLVSKHDDPTLKPQLTQELNHLCIKVTVQINTMYHRTESG